MTVESAPATASVSDLLQRLAELLRGFPSALVAYSGGVDSAVVMAAAHRALGGRAVACIGVSPSLAERERKEAVAIAEQIGASYRLVETHEHLDPNYAANPENRCYFCKSELYDRLQEIAAKDHVAVILDGNNASDLVATDRPGWMAARERNVRSPLAELGITKPLVRALARELGLPIWDKPAAPCLSSRVPHGTAITPEMLKQIERAEDVLVALGFRTVRVRHHDTIARIELSADDLPRALEVREQLARGIKAAGYALVTLDLDPFKSGRLHVLNNG